MPLLYNNALVADKYCPFGYYVWNGNGLEMEYILQFNVEPNL